MHLPLIGRNRGDGFATWFGIGCHRRRGRRGERTVTGPSAAWMPQSSLQGRGGFTRSTASRRRAPEICDFGPGPGGGFTACPVTVRSPRRPRRRWHPMPNHVANPSPRLRPIKGRCISVYRLPQRRHSPSARCPTARRWHRASDRWRGCICRDRLPQGCGSRAYRDVFTACPCGYNPSSDPAPYPPRCNAGRHKCRHECRPTVPAQSA